MKKTLIYSIVLLAACLCLAAFTYLPLPAVVAQQAGFTQQLFDQFIEMRVGTGAPVYWYCYGELYAYPTGKLLAKVEGIDTDRLGNPADRKKQPDTALQLSRKVFVYRDPTTNAILREVNGQRVKHIEYPYQMITYRLKDGAVTTAVEQGVAPRIQKIEGSNPITARRFGELSIFSAPLFLNIETPRGKYEAYENYDFLRQPKKTGAPQYQLSWNRYGDQPAFYGPGRSMIQLLAYRVDRYQDLPATIREFLEKEATLWMQPPKDIEEIRQLQKGETPTGKN